MKAFVWDYYKSDVRIVLTVVLLGVAVLASLGGIGAWGGLFILAAGIAFHTESKLSLDIDSRTYRRGVVVKPFGRAIQGSFDDIDCILLSVHDDGQGNRSFRAYIMFRPVRFAEPKLYRVASGALPQVLKQAKELANSTGLRVVESEKLQNERKEFESAFALTQRRNSP